MKNKRICLAGLLCALPFFFVLSASGACSHQYTPKVRLREATCTEAGLERQECIYCHKEREASIPARGHEFSSEYTVDVAPSCGTPGQKSRHCLRCSAVTDIVSLQAPSHEFTYSSVAPTCTEYGYRLRKCRNCGHEVKDQFVDPPGHTRGTWVVDKAATCTNTGVRSVSCTVCGAVVEQKPIPVAEHLYTQSTIAPTCTLSGYTLHTCTVCGAQKKTNSRSALGHSYSDSVIPPSCEEKGCTLRTCSRCGAQTKTNSTKALGHEYPAQGVRTKAPSCTEKGEETLTCTRCGATKQQTVPALGHSYDSAWTTDKVSTCTAKGEQSHHCVRCGKRRDVTSLPLAGHSPAADTDAAPTCTAAGKTGGTHCAVCGKTLTAPAAAPALGHTFGESVTLTEPTCTEKGSAQRTCARCGKTETAAVPALGHSYSEAWTVDKAPTCTAQGERSHRCVRCGKRKDVTALEKTPHAEVTDPVVDPTCTEPGKTAGAHCKTCGKVLLAQKEIPAPGHDLQVIAEITPATCSEKGRAMMACKVCGAALEQDVPALGHQFDGTWTVDIPPTCTAQGEQSHRCLRCGKRTDVTALPREAHTVVYEGVVEPTCTKAGRADRAFCGVCGKELAEKTTIPARGHTPETAVTPATTKADGSTKTFCKVCGTVLKSGTVARIGTVSLSAKTFAFSGEKRLPELTVRDSAGKTLKEGECYTVKWPSGCTEIGSYKLKILFRGNYAGSVKRKFQIVPQKVTGLDFTAAQNRIDLTWKPVATATCYRVYLFNEQTGHYTALKTVKQPRCSLRDLLPGAVYVLCVRACAKQGTTTFAGALSQKKATATRPLQPAAAGEVKNGRAVLHWQSCGDCVYEIYAAEKKNGKFRLLGTTEKERFVTKAFPQGSTRCFKVRALVRRNGTDLSGRSSEILTLRF